jgi:uncharacterized protein YjbI with pentapeptide repeats
MSFKLVDRLVIAASAASLMGLVGFTPAQAFVRSHLDHFLRTGRCPGCDLSSANLSYLDLRGSDLRNADLRRANLSYSDLSYSDLRGADLRGANTVGTIFEQIRR